MNIFKFGADGTAYARGLNKMRGQTKQFTSQISGMLKGAFAFVGIRGVANVLKDMDRVQKLGQRFEMPAETIQRLGFAAEQSGTSLEVIAKGLAQANRSAIEAGAGLKTYQRAFQDLGINWQDFAKLDQEGQFMALADAVASAADKNRAMAASQVLLGRAGLELLPLLKQGSAGYKKLTGDLGVFSQKQADSAARFNDAVNKMKKTATVFVVDVVGKIASGVRGSRAVLAERASMAQGSGFWDRLGDVFKPVTVQQQARLDLAWEFGTFGEELDARIKEESGKIAGKAIQTVLDVSAVATGMLEAGKKERSEIEARKERVSQAQKDMGFEELTTAEKLKSVKEDIAAEMERLSHIGFEYGKFSEQAEKKALEIIKLQTKEKSLQKDLQNETTAEMQQYVTAAQDAAIAVAESMSGEEQIADASANLDTTAPSIITSALQSIGGGGGVAVFGNDPLLNENKRQTVVLEAIRDGLYGFNPITGETTSRPEL